MGNVQPSRLLDAKLLDSNTITGLSYLEDGQFAKIYKVEIEIYNYIYRNDKPDISYLHCHSRVTWCQQKILSP